MKKPEHSTLVVPPMLTKVGRVDTSRPAASEPLLARKISDTEANLGRRRVPRRTFDSAIGLLAKGAYRLARSYQVGEGGMMVSGEQQLISGQMVVVSFYLPSQALIVVRGIVRSAIPADEANQLPERFGIEFVNLGFQFKREIRNFVASATGAEAA